MKSIQLFPAIILSWVVLCLGLYFSTILPTLAETFQRVIWFWSVSAGWPGSLATIAPAHLASAGTVLLISLAGWSSGNTLLAWSRVRAHRHAAITLTAGLVIIMPVFVFGLGMVGLFRTPVFASALAIPALGGLFRIRFSGFSTLRWQWLAVGGLLLAPSILCALVPETQYDALQYHLAIPRRFLEAGRIYLADPWPHANFHLAMETLFVPAMAIGGDGAAKLLNWQFFPLLLVLVRLAATAAGITGIASHLPWMVIASSPLFSSIAGQTFTDCAAACAITAAILLRLGPRPPAFIIGALVGAAGAVKLPSMAYGLAILPFLAPRGLMLVAGLGWSLPLIAWPVKSFLLTGTPFGGIAFNTIWPSFLQSESSLNFLKSGAWTPLGHHSLWLTFPLTLLKGAVLTGFEVSPFLPALIPLALLPGPRRYPFLRWAVVASFVLWPFTGGGQIRFLVPFVPLVLLASLAGNPLDKFTPPALLRISTVFIASLGFIRICSFLFVVGNPVNAALGTVDSRSYLAGIITPTPIYMSVASQIKDSVRLGKPYIAGDIKSYYWPRHPRNDSQFLNPLLFRWARDSHNPGEIAAKFRQSGIGCIAHNLGGAITMEVITRGYPWTNRSLDILQKFWFSHMIPAGYFENRGKDNWIGLWEFDYRGNTRLEPAKSHWLQIPYTEGLLLKADLDLNHGRLEKAEKEYHRLELQWPRFALIPLRLAEISRLRGNTKKMREQERMAARLIKSIYPE